MRVSNVSGGEVEVILDQSECNALSHACYESLEHMKERWDKEYIKQVELMGAFFTMAFHAAKEPECDHVR